MIIPGQFGFNCPRGFREEAFWNIFPFQNASSLKPLGQLKPNCPGMIIGRSSTSFCFNAILPWLKLGVKYLWGRKSKMVKNYQYTCTLYMYALYIQVCRLSNIYCLETKYTVYDKLINVYALL
jgi:hypothetical protein